MITKMCEIPKIIDHRERGGRHRFLVIICPKYVTETFPLYAHNYCHVRKINNIYNTHIRELVILY